MNTEFFVKIKNPIEKADSTYFDELKVSIDQCKGVYNYAYGCYWESGINIFFTPIHREGNCITFTPLGNVVESGFKIHVLDAKRKSQKKIDMIASAIKPILNKFGEIWGQYDFNHTIFNMVKDAIENISLDLIKG